VYSPYSIKNFIHTLVSIFSFFPFFLVTHCLFIIFFKKWIGPLGTFYGSLITFSFCLGLAVNELFIILRTGQYYYVDFGRWFFCLDIIDSHLVFCIDSLALTAAILVLLLTTFALYFGVEYMYREAFINRLLYLLNLFATSVIFLFFCYDYFLVMFAWECIGLFSFLLVNFYSTRIYTIKAALKTFVFSRISDMFMFTSFLLTLVVFNTTDLSLIFLQTPFMAFHYLFFGTTALHFLTFFSTCLVLSGGIKAAQFFAHVWLPDAMEAPTPASALIHSSTLVVAGVFLIIRFGVVLEFTLLTNHLLIVLGALTLSFGSITAIFQNDIKKLVAYSTISQIGYLVCGCGFGCYEEVLIYLIIHALNKAFLFVLVGYTVHFFNGNTDMRQMGGAYLYSFDIAVLLFGVCLNLAGLPYSAGFLGKEFLLFQVLRDDFLSLFVRGCWIVSFFFTPIYMFILVFVVFFGPKKGVLMSYLPYWLTFFKTNFWLVFNTFTNKVNLQKAVYLNLYQFQFTIITSRTTIYVLFLFWCFFFFFGEFLLLITFNMNTLNELIPSNYFTFFKTHTIFLLDNNNNYLTEIIMFYILFFTTSSFLFLFNLKYTFIYESFYHQLALDTIFLVVMLLLFQWILVLCLYIFIILKRLN
jgi:NADH-quinone oxidoreductase subunit L